jgi:hypothetical protein
MWVLALVPLLGPIGGGGGGFVAVAGLASPSAAGGAGVGAAPSSARTTTLLLFCTLWKLTKFTRGEDVLVPATHGVSTNLVAAEVMLVIAMQLSYWNTHCTALVPQVPKNLVMNPLFVSRLDLAWRIVRRVVASNLMRKLSPARVRALEVIPTSTLLPCGSLSFWCG